MGSIFPIIILTSMSGSWILIAGGLALIGIFLTEFVRIRVPQLIPLS